MIRHACPNKSAREVPRHGRFFRGGLSNKICQEFARNNYQHQYRKIDCVLVCSNDDGFEQ